MNLLKSSVIVIWVLVMVFQSNILSIQSELIEKYLPNPTNWFVDDENANLAKFDSFYFLFTERENLVLNDKICAGWCSLLDHVEVNPSLFPNSNQCSGNIGYCWNNANATAQKNCLYWDNCGWNDYSRDKLSECRETLRHHADRPKCVCHGIVGQIPAVDLDFSKSVDSICYDPVSVDEGLVATGARFTRHDNVIYLQLRQGELSNGRIVPSNKKWTDIKNCSPANRKLVLAIVNQIAVGLEIILEDIKLPENAVVTGVTLGESVRGRYLTNRGNIDESQEEIVVRSKCNKMQTHSVFSGTPRIMTKSCDDYVPFSFTPTFSNKHFVPYVDMQEIVTSSPDEPIRGIGWYHRGYSDHGGYLALKIFYKG